MERHRVLLLLGSNLGDRAEVLASARSRLAAEVGRVTAASREYETAPWGTFVEDEEKYPFLNQAIAIETELEAEALLDGLQRIERDLGRPVHRPEYDPETNARRYRARTIDIDMLFYDSDIIDTERLTIPHPRLPERRFALEPATEIWPDYVHPVLKISLKELFNSLLLGDSQ